MRHTSHGPTCEHIILIIIIIIIIIIILINLYSA